MYDVTMSKNFRLATTVYGADHREAKTWLERLDKLNSLEEMRRIICDGVGQMEE